MDIEVLKSYLVSLGFQVNQPELRKFELGLKDAGAIVESATTGVVRNLLKWQFAATSAFVGVSGAVIGMADHVAMADQKYRLLGLRMFMSTEQARRMQMSLDALGVSLEDAVWDPETRSRFIEMGELQDRLSKQLGTNFRSNMIAIRDVKQRFQELGVTIEYVSMAFISRLVEKLGPNLEELQGKVQKFIDYIIENVPAWADAFAENVVPVLKETWEIVKDLGLELGGLLVDFTNLIGLLTGDKSIEGTELSFHKLAGAIQHVVAVLGGMLITVSHATRIVFDLAGALVALLSGRPSDAMGYAKSAMALLGPDAGGLLGGVIGTLIAPGIGTAAGAAIGAGLGGAAKLYTSSNDRPATSAGTSSDIASQARALAVQVGAQLGVSPKLVFEQWQHETNGFRNRGATSLNNLGGIKNPGGVGYRSFGSLDEYATYYTGMMNRNFSGVHGAQTEEDWVRGLKNGRLGAYMEDSAEHYINGMKRWGAQDAGMFDGGGSNVSIGNVSVNIMQPHATADQIQAHVTKGISDYAKQQRQQTQRNIAQLAVTG